MQPASINLRLINVLVNEKGEIECILDCANCISNLAAEWDLCLALDDLSIDAKQELLIGCGLTPKQISLMSPAGNAITVITCAPAAQRAAIADYAAKLDSFRTRLSGHLDLFSL